MNYVWFDSVGLGYVSRRNGAGSWMSRNCLIRYIWLRFEKSSPKCRIVGEEAENRIFKPIGKIAED